MRRKSDVYIMIGCLVTRVGDERRNIILVRDPDKTCVRVTSKLVDEAVNAFPVL